MQVSAIKTRNATICDEQLSLAFSQKHSRTILRQNNIFSQYPMIRNAEFFRKLTESYIESLIFSIPIKLTNNISCGVRY